MWTATILSPPTLAIVGGKPTLTVTVQYDDGAGTVFDRIETLTGPPDAAWLRRLVRDRIKDWSTMETIAADPNNGRIPHAGAITPAADDTPADTVLAQLRSDIAAVATLNMLVSAGIYPTSIWTNPTVAAFTQSIKDRINAHPAYLTQLY